MASTDCCTSFPYILYAHTHRSIRVCACKSVRPTFLFPLPFIPHLREMMDHWIPDKCIEGLLQKLVMGRSSYQDIFTGVQLRLPTHDELKVLETFALTSCFCLCTFSITLSLP